MKRFTLRLPNDLHDKIRELARLEKRSIHAQILYILEHYLKETHKCLAQQYAKKKK